MPHKKKTTAQKDKKHCTRQAKKVQKGKTAKLAGGRCQMKGPKHHH